MITIDGYYYDGRSSLQTPVTITFFRSGEVQIKGTTLSLTTKLDRLSIAARLGNTRRNIFLSDGAKLETENNDAIDQLCRRFAQNRFDAFLFKMERHWRYVVLAFAISSLFIWGGIEYGVPVAAKWTARGVPQNVEQEVGEQGLESLDRWLFAASAIEPARQAQLRKRFREISTHSASGYRYRLLLRNSRQMGANALALPGGSIIVTDGLVQLAENDEQIMAALAHEMGHVDYQHGLRSALQNSLTALLMAGLLGDITSVSSLSATLPTILVENRYSRKFELEADAYAVALLQSQQIDPEQLVRMLVLLEHTHQTAKKFDYLSSHPETNKRIARIESMLKQ